jgi:hypothetical protein
MQKDKKAVPYCRKERNKEKAVRWSLWLASGMLNLSVKFKNDF